MNDSDYQTAEDLAGKVVVTQADSSALAALTSTEDNEENLALKDSFAELQEVPDYNSAFLNLESGAVDCIAVDIGVAQYQLTSRGDTSASWKSRSPQNSTVSDLRREMRNFAMPFRKNYLKCMRTALSRRSLKSTPNTTFLR